MARSFWVSAVVGVLIGLESPTSTSPPPTCSGTAPSAQALLSTGPAMLRTTHDDINLFERDGVTVNELDATFRHVTLGVGANLRILTGDTLQFFSATPSSESSPPHRLPYALTGP